MRVAAEWAREHEAPLHVHVSEQRQENEACEDLFSWSPVELLRREDVLGPRTTLVHATHVSTSDIGSIAESGAAVCMCPTTERDLADGVGPSRELADASVGLCIGTDAHSVIDPFEELRSIELHQRLQTLERGGHQPADLLAAGTINGYRTLGWADGGTLTVGAPADFTSVRLDSVRTVGSAPDTLLASVLFSATAADVTHVVIGGRMVVENGAHVRIDTTAALDRAIAAVSG